MIHTPAHRGFTLFLTGLSGSGKSTLGAALWETLQTRYGRTVSFLDGDAVRQHLSRELGYSKAHRDMNVMRIGYVAAEVTRHGGIAICAAIAPYAETRARVRQMIERLGGFVEVHVNTPVSVCEQRDPKGLYARARAGMVRELTGIDAPYEPPERPELVVDTSEVTLAGAVERIVAELERRHILSRPAAD